MPDEFRGEKTVSMEELTEMLADATGTTPEEIERGAEECYFGPPEEMLVVEVDGEPVEPPVPVKQVLDLNDIRE